MREGASRARAARAVAAGAGLFSTVVALVLLLDVLQMRSVDPLATPGLESLRARLRQSPQDEALRDEIRALDLLARKAFFAGQWQRRTGAWLLLGGLATTLVALRVLVRERRRSATPEGRLDADAWWVSAARGRRWVAVAGGVIAGAALVAGATARSALDVAPPGASASPDSTAAGALGPDDWPGFRGPDGTGVARDARAPVSWDGRSGRGIAWKTEVPLAGHGSPIVVADRVFVAGADEKTQEVYCFDRRDGRLRWRRAVVGRRAAGAEAPRTHPDTGFAPSTMASDGRRVFAIFPTGDLAAFDLDGAAVWLESLGAPDNHYGHASSLVTFAGRLIVQWDESADARLVAYDAASGQLAWRAPRDTISWASPALVESAGRRELVVNDSRSVASYDPRTGALLWRSECLGGEVGPSPAFAGGLVFVANDRATAAALRPGGEVVWRYGDELPDTASPVATPQLVFLATSYGVIVCLDAKTGRELWKHETPAGFYASPILVGDRVYALDLQGVTHVFRAASSWTPLGTSPLGEAAMATPAFAAGQAYIRGQRFLYGISGE